MFKTERNKEIGKGGDESMESDNECADEEEAGDNAEIGTAQARSTAKINDSKENLVKVKEDL